MPDHCNTFPQHAQPSIAATSNTGSPSTSLAPAVRYRAGLGWVEGAPIAGDVAAWVRLLSSIDAGAVPVPLQGAPAGVYGGVVVGEGVHIVRGEQGEVGRVRLSGTALERLGADGCWGVLRALHGGGCRWGRIDVYLDIVGGITARTVLQAVQTGAVTSSWRSWTMWENDQGGVSVYLGAPRAPVRLVVYDKGAERYKKSQKVTPGAAVPWTRFELRYRGPAAGAVAPFLLAGPEVIPALLRARATFRTPSADGNHSRWPIAPWWGALPWWEAGAVQGGVLSLQPTSPPERVSLLDRRMRWLINQAAPSLALAYRCKGMAFVRYLLNQGEGRLTPAERAEIAAQRAARQEDTT